MRLIKILSRSWISRIIGWLLLLLLLSCTFLNGLAESGILTNLRSLRDAFSWSLFLRFGLLRRLLRNLFSVRKWVALDTLNISWQDCLRLVNVHFVLGAHRNRVEALVCLLSKNFSLQTHLRSGKTFSTGSCLKRLYFFILLE